MLPAYDSRLGSLTAGVAALGNDVGLLQREVAPPRRIEGFDAAPV